MESQEKHNIEWKSVWKDEYLVGICAFANAQGGKFFIGIDDNGKIITVNKEGTEALFECDSVIIAISQLARNNIVSNTTGLEINKWGLLITDESGHTTKEGVFASGDVATGADTVVRAAAHAKLVAEEIDKFIKLKYE